MVRENIYQSLEVFYEKVDTCPLGNRRFNFFELVYVISGKGTYAVNDNVINFQSSDLFLTTPNDRHTFDLKGMCEFIVVRFSQNYVNEYQWKTIDHIECVLHHASHFSESLIVNEEDKKIVSLLMINIQNTISQDALYNEDLLRHFVNAVLVIAARNISMIYPKKLTPNADTRILEIVDYIQTNICNPQLLRIAVIAEKFDLSSTYLGAYFLKNCGETIQQFISNYRIRLIEHRLQFSDMRISEIVEEFGFADESHINKFFKRHKGISLSAFRKTFTLILINLDLLTSKLFF